ncbi:MAG: hypothetical protein IT162_07055 [Bryobacterales bacterium]|nr:hypothetical protein [Bryobacterales bacterium]
MSQAAANARPRTDFAHVPVTFSSYLVEQMRAWETLFPAERSYLERLSALLEHTAKDVFAPLETIEKKMGVDAAHWPRDRFTLEQVDFLNRNAHYPEWRAEIARLFSQIDPILEKEVTSKGRPRLVVIIGPADLPVGPDRMWTRLQGKGRRVKLKTPENLDHYLPLLLTGKAGGAANAWKDGAYQTWVVETGDRLGTLVGGAAPVRLSYQALEAYRARLMKEVDRLVKDSSIRGPRQLSERLKTLRVTAAESAFAADPVLMEFLRATLLAGNGTLLINNTFVEWASVQAFRRARPEVLIAGFGIRNKMKPFSSLLIFHDQEKATALPTQADMLGSYVDLEVMYQYVFQEAAKHPEYRHNTAHLLVADGMDELQLIAPADFPLAAGSEPVELAAVWQAARDWMRL